MSFFGGPDCFEVYLGRLFVVVIAALEFFGRLGSAELLGSELPVADMVIRESVLLEDGEFNGVVIVCDSNLEGFVPFGGLVSTHVSHSTCVPNAFLVLIHQIELYIRIHLSSHVSIDCDHCVLNSQLKGSLLDEKASRSTVCSSFLLCFSSFLLCFLSSKHGLCICLFLVCFSFSFGLIL